MRSVRFSPQAADHAIVLFDGECVLCNGSVNFIYHCDSRSYFRFTSLQSDVGARLLAEHGIPQDLGTIVLIENGLAYTRSTAVLRIARHLGWPWKLLYGLRIIPRFLRDAIYTAIARRRYRWFGRRDYCPLPPPGLRERCLVGQNTAHGRPQRPL